MNCPICNTAMVEIWYGLPTSAKIEKARNDEIVLGGTNRKPYTHYCNVCQETYPQTNVSFSNE